MTPEEAGCKLGESLLLGERGQLVLVICDVEEDLREIVRHAYDRAGGEPEVHWLWKEKPGDPPFNTTSALAVLDRLEQVHLTPGPASSLLVLSALAAARAEVDLVSWKWLFQRLNERRNNILQAFRGVLLIALPPSIEADFSESAPDMWSVRSDVFRLSRAPSARVVERRVHRAGSRRLLADFLLDLFTPHELHPFVSSLSRGAQVSQRVPWGAPPIQVVHEIVRILDLMELPDTNFFNTLRHWRPERAAEIAKIERELQGIGVQRPLVAPPEADERLLQSIAYRLHPAEQAELIALAGLDEVLPRSRSSSIGLMLVQEMVRQDRLEELARLMAEVAPDTVRRVTRQS